MAQENVILELKNIRKSYGTSDVIKDISIDVHKGEVIVIIGPSGCGKSTLLRTINGLEEIQGGEIKLHDKVITGKKTDWISVRQQIGMVFQSYDLFPHKTVIENLMLAPVKVQKRNKKEVILEARKMLERVGLSDKADVYPRQLSGGQKQRVAIVRTLLMHPEILLFDEVTAALDPEMVREVLDVILDLAKEGATMLIVTHEMSFARAIADRVILIDNGVVEEQGTPRQIFDSPKKERTKRFLQTFEYEEKEGSGI